MLIGQGANSMFNILLGFEVATTKFFEDPRLVVGNLGSVLRRVFAVADDLEEIFGALE